MNKPNREETAIVYTILYTNIYINKIAYGNFVEDMDKCDAMNEIIKVNSVKLDSGEWKCNIL